MKTSIALITTALLAATTQAAPAPEPEAWRGGWGGFRGNKDNKDCPKPLIPFTSTFSVVATPEQVVNGTAPTGGLAGAIGYYDFGLNSDLDLICYHIRLVNFRGEYQSPANTATHIHEAARGASGPPRIAFPNPKAVAGGVEGERISAGCLSGPFTTGVKNATTGLDAGAGFTVRRIEEQPAAFFADVHSSLAVPGAVRGQLA